jgi:hypothetical protein
VTEPVRSVKGRALEEEWAAARVKEAVEVRGEVLVWEQEGIVFAPVVARRWRIRWAFPATGLNAPSAGNR